MFVFYNPCNKVVKKVNILRESSPVEVQNYWVVLGFRLGAHLIGWPKYGEKIEYIKF